MPLANTLGVCLLLVWPRASVVPSVSAASVWELTRPQEGQSSDSSPQISSPQSPVEPRKTPTQSTTPKPTAGTSQACPKNSSPGSNAKSGCKRTAGIKAKKQPATQKAAETPTTPSDADIQKKVVPDGGADDPPVDNLSPKPGPQALQQAETAKQLLISAEANLKRISADQLTPTQQETVKQINRYMEQSREAAKGGDPQRAYNLAVKANLLSADLVGH